MQETHYQIKVLSQISTKWHAFVGNGMAVILQITIPSAVHDDISFD